MLLAKNTIILVTLLASILLSSCKLLGTRIPDINTRPEVNTIELKPAAIEKVGITNVNNQDIFVAQYDNPFDIVNQRANTLLKHWLSRPSELKAFVNAKPKKPIPSPAKLLTKEEFETTNEFRERITIQEAQSVEQAKQVENEYQEKINQYNESVNIYNTALVSEKRNRQKSYNKKYWQFVNENIPKVLGDPAVKIVEYNADKAIYYAVLGSSKSNLSQWISIFVSRDEAILLKNNSNNILPILEFEQDSNNKLKIINISVNVGANNYTAELINKPSINNYEYVIKSNPINIIDNYLEIN